MRFAFVGFISAVLVIGGTRLEAQSLPECPKRQSIREVARGFIGTWMRYPPGANVATLHVLTPFRL